jgi:MFS family permease
MLYFFVEREKTKNARRYDTVDFNLHCTPFIGAQFGTVISMPLSGLLSISTGGWPSIFYVFGAVGTVWCIAFLFLVFEDPEANPRMNIDEKKYIQKALGNKTGAPVSMIVF